MTTPFYDDGTVTATRDSDTGTITITSRTGAVSLHATQARTFTQALTDAIPDETPGEQWARQRITTSGPTPDGTLVYVREDSIPGHARPFLPPHTKLRIEADGTEFTALVGLRLLPI